jgi:GH15 family glucan-1,4-alpha-glucosidase
MLDATYLAQQVWQGISHDGWLSMKRVLEWLYKNWKRPDEGIWEIRGGRQHFLHSRLMCWVACSIGPSGWRKSAPSPVLSSG